MAEIEERGSTHVYKVNRISKEEIDSMVERCIYEEAPHCNAACPLKLDTRAMLKAVAEGEKKKALQIYEKAAPFPLILSMGCEAPCEAKCRLCEVGDGVAIRDVEAAVARHGQQSRLGSIFRTRKKKTAAAHRAGHRRSLLKELRSFPAAEDQVVSRPGKLQRRSPADAA